MKVWEFIRDFSVMAWVRVILTIVCAISSMYVIYYGFSNIHTTHGLAFILTGFLSLFMIHRLYEILSDVE